MINFTQFSVNGKDCSLHPSDSLSYSDLVRMAFNVKPEEALNPNAYKITWQQKTFGRVDASGSFDPSESSVNIQQAMHIQVRKV